MFDSCIQSAYAAGAKFHSPHQFLVLCSLVPCFCTCLRVDTRFVSIFAHRAVNVEFRHRQGLNIQESCTGGPSKCYMQLKPLRRYRKFYCIDRFRGVPWCTVRHSRANSRLFSFYRQFCQLSFSSKHVFIGNSRYL